MNSSNRFFNRAWDGKNELPWYLLSNVIVWLTFLILGSIPVTVAILTKMVDDVGLAGEFMDNPNDFSQIGISPTVMFILVMLQFVIGFFGVFFCTKVILKRPFHTIITGADKFRWGHFLKGAFSWALLMGMYFLLLNLVKPDLFETTFNAGRFFLFLPVALILVPIQSSFEELAFRGLFLQTVFRAVPRFPILGFLLQGLLFGLIHSFNPEVEKYGFFLMMSHYVGFGLILGLFTWLDEGAEMSMGIHSANNLFSFLIVSYEGIALQSPSVFIQKETSPAMEFLAILVMALVVLLVFFRKDLGKLKSLVKMPDN